MKRLLKSVAVVALTISVNSAVQAQKVAHVAMDSILTLMPETKKAQEVAQNYLKQLEKEITTMKTEFETKYNDYVANEATYSDMLKKTKQDELQRMNQNMEEFKANAQQDYQKKYGELSKPIYEKANKAIKEVAKELGYKYVLDTSTGVVIYSEPGEDITAAVKKKLDSMPEASLPGLSSTTATSGTVKNAPATTAPKNQTPAKGK